jgi:hypothetical protein
VVKPKHIEGGLFNRILWFSYPVNANDMTSSQGIDTARWDASQALWATWHQTLSEHRNCNSTCRDCYGLGRAGFCAWRSPTRFNQAVEQRILRDPRRQEAIVQGDRLGSFYQRMMAHIQLVAGLYAFSCGRWVVEESDLNAAMALADYCLGVVEGEITTGLAVTRVQGLRNRIIDRVNKTKTMGISRSKLMRDLAVGSPDLTLALEALIGDGTIIEMDGNKPSRGATPKWYYGSVYAPAIEK